MGVYAHLVEHTIFPRPETDEPLRLSTPKRERLNGSIYRYYAGFSNAFVDDIIDHYVQEGARVLDPWNGSGTTTSTSVCAERGIDCVGMDINPGTLAIAWSRFARIDLINRLYESFAAASTDELMGQIDCSSIRGFGLCLLLGPLRSRHTQPQERIDHYDGRYRWR